MIKVANIVYKRYGERWSRQFENANRIGNVGKAYLRSITEAKSTHVYKSWWRLAFKCLMADKVQAAALSVNDKLGFADMKRILPKLDSRYWGKDKGGDFYCKTTKEFAKAVSIIFTSKLNNALECKGLSHVMALRALQLSMNNTRFDKLIKAFLGGKRLRIPLDTIKVKNFMMMESLKASRKEYFIYEGDRVYRPGDIIAVGNLRSEAVRTQWLVENGICVGWRGAADGRAQYDEPLFVGGGVPSQVMTEAQIREYVYQKTKSYDRITGNRKHHFAEKALGTTKCRHKLDKRYEEGPRKGQLIYGLDVVPDIYLNTEVNRIAILGGRTDILDP
jgi:hypothetical protein